MVAGPLILIKIATKPANGRVLDGALRAHRAAFADRHA